MINPIEIRLNYFLLGFAVALAALFAVDIFTQSKSQKTQRGRKILLLAAINLSISAGLGVGWLIYGIIAQLPMDANYIDRFCGVMQILEMMTYPIWLHILLRIIRTEKSSITLTCTVMSILAIAAVIFTITGIDLIWQCVAGAMFIYFLIGIICIYIQAKKYERMLDDSYANHAERSSGWVMTVSLAFVLILIMYEFMAVVWHTVYTDIIYNSLCVLPTIYLYRKFTTHNFDIHEIEEVVEAPKAENTTATPSDLGDRIKSYCEKYETFSNNELTIVDVAKAVGSNRTYVSRWFRESGSDFYDYMASVRLRYVAKQLLETQDTINSIAIEAGFKSMSHFRTAFMNQYNCTPSEFRSRAGR